MSDGLRTFRARVYAYVARIPAGRVATYGQLAFLAGNPRASRIVGAAMYHAPQERGLPCHRVVYRDGSLCQNGAFGGPDGQRAMLEAEGVLFLPDGRVDLRRCLWHEDTEAGAELAPRESRRA